MVKHVSILNDVLGPVMRGPSSSHTAGAYHIGRLARDLLGEEPMTVTFTFDPRGSFAGTLSEHCSDLALAAGVLGWSITDERFPRALELAAQRGVEIGFSVGPVSTFDHPNMINVHAVSNRGRRVHATAISVGGGAVLIREVDGWPVEVFGDAYDVLVECVPEAEEAVRALLIRDGQAFPDVARQERDDRVLVHARREEALRTADRAELDVLPGVLNVWATTPIFFVPHGEPIFNSADEMLFLAERRNVSLGALALAYESALLELPEPDVRGEVQRRYRLMRDSVAEGLRDQPQRMKLLQPSAPAIFRAEQDGRLPIGGLHTRAVARALGVMHRNAASGVVCAAPTGGASGVLPGVLVTLAEEKGWTEEQCVMGLLAGSAVGVIIGRYASFSGSVAGCQVEVGSASAMAAAAIVEGAGGSPRQVVDAASVAIQNLMGLICDPVQGYVEIPCTVRNGIGVSNAMICADMVMGGYANPIPLGQTIDAMYRVGCAMPLEMRGRGGGGLTGTPAARSMQRLQPA